MLLFGTVVLIHVACYFVERGTFYPDISVKAFDRAISSTLCTLYFIGLHLLSTNRNISHFFDRHC